MITYTPDSAGRIVSAVDSANNINYVTSAAYQADGQMAAFVRGNGASFAGMTNSFSYNKRQQPVNISASSPSQRVFSIGYDFHAGNGTAGSGSDNGDVWNLYNFRDRTRDQSFNYDALNRLISAQNAGTNCAATTLNGKTEYWGNTYGYDPWGNLIAKSVSKCSAENLSLTALPNNQLSGYGYEAAGNMTSDTTDVLRHLVRRGEPYQPGRQQRGHLHIRCRRQSGAEIWHASARRADRRELFATIRSCVTSSRNRITQSRLPRFLPTM